MRSSFFLMLSALVLGFGCSSETTGAGSAGTSTSSSASSSGSSGSTGSGGSGSCSNDAACGESNGCVVRTCENGKCVAQTAEPGTVPVDGQVFGDCSRYVCGQDGALEVVDDDLDAPTDFNQCTEDTCAAGAPVHTMLPELTQCGTNDQLACIAGVCTGCKNDDQCAAGDSCHDPVCTEGPGGPAADNGTCGVEVAVGKELSNSDPADCFHAVCDQDGAVIVAPQPNEIPAQDDEACTVERCTQNGTIVSDPLPEGSSCGPFCAPASCSESACMESTPPADGTEVPGAQTAGDCKSVVCQGGVQATVSHDGDPPADGNLSDCVQPACSGGQPTVVNKPSGSPCSSGGVICNGDGQCTF
jgi:hypothetical protein